MTVGQLLDEYLDGIDTDGRLSPKTRHDYRRNADAYVRPWPGEHRVRALTPEAILAWQRQLSERTGTRRGRPLAPNTVRLARASLAGAVRLAVESGVLRTNPLASVQHPKARRSTPRHWLPEQAREFLASQAGHRLYPLWAFLCWGRDFASGARLAALAADDPCGRITGDSALRRPLGGRARRRGAQRRLPHAPVAPPGSTAWWRHVAVAHYLSTRARTTPITKTLWIECTMIPIHALWKRRVG
jgi:hypothetical protein